MELIEVSEIPANVATGSRLRVSHSATKLSRCLEPGERAVLRDGAGGCHSATVVDLEFDLYDTHYVFEIGRPQRFTTQSVRDLFTSLRDQRKG